MSFILEGRGQDGIRKMLEGKLPVQYKLDIPVVLLGGPVKAYYYEIKGMIDAEVVVPEYADVGNAVGALVSRGINRVEILIRPESMENPDQNFLVFFPTGRKKFEDYRVAMEHAQKIGRDLVMESLKNFKLPDDAIKIESSIEYLTPPEWKHIPMETKLTFVGVCIPEYPLEGEVN